MARKMVCEWGMSDLGPMSFGKKDEQIFLGREIAQHRDFSEATAIKIDEQVRMLVDQGYKVARELIEQHREAMVRIGEALLEREVLDGSEVLQLIKGETLAAARQSASIPTHKSNDDPGKTSRSDSGLRVPPLVDGPQPA